MQVEKKKKKDTENRIVSCRQGAHSISSAGLLTHLQRLFSSLRKAEKVDAFEIRDIKLIYSHFIIHYCRLFYTQMVPDLAIEMHFKLAPVP